MYQNNQYGYPQNQYGQPPQQQAMGLPFSQTEMQNPPIQLAYGQPPIQIQLNAPPELQPHTAMILFQLVQALQGRASGNRLRTFLYNQMSQNCYANDEFVKLANMTAECIDLVMRTQPNSQIGSVIDKTCQNVVQFVTAANTSRYPALTQGLMPQDIHQIQNALGQFDSEISAMKQALMAPPQQNGGWGNQGGWNQQPAPGMYAGGYQQNRQVGGAGHPAISSAYSGYATPTPPPQSWKGRPQKEQIVTPPKVVKPEVTSIPNARKTFRSGYKESTTVNNTSIIRSVDPSTLNLPPAPIIAKTEFDILTKQEYDWLLTQGYHNTETWKCTQAYPYSVAFNPSATELFYLLDSKSNIRPVIVKKEESPMDREAHLTAPKIAPSWTFSMPSETVDKDPHKRIMALVPEDLVYEDFKGKVVTAASQEDHWGIATAYLGSILIDGNNKRQVITFPGVQTDSIVANNLFKQSMADLSSTVTPKETMYLIEYMYESANERSERHDVLLLGKINQRLTDRINRFIKNELALTTGTIDSFITDILELVPFLEKTYGDAVAKTFLAAYPEMVDSALAFAKEEMHKGLLEYYCDGFLDKVPGTAGIRDLLSFYQKNEYALVDLSSVELQVDLGSTKVAVGVKESLTPLFYNVCRTLLGEYDPTKVIKTYTRYFIRTNDGVTFEVFRGAINKDFIFVNLAGK